MSSNYPAIQKKTDPDAIDVLADTTAFNGILSASDIDVQKSLETIDDITTTNVPEGTNLYYTDARVGAYIEGDILKYGFESVTVSTTVTKTKTVFTGSTTGQTITLPTVGTAGREIEVFNDGTVKVLLSGSSVLSELYPNESAQFTETGSDWIA